MTNKIFKIIVVIAIIFIVSLCLWVVNNKTENNYKSDDKIPNNNYNSNDINETNEEEVTSIMKMYIKINDKTLTATLDNNSSVDALVEKLQEGNITITMNDYANMEKVGSLGFDLPRNDENIETNAGDLILYQGNSFVIYYDHNNWSLTRLGKIEDITSSELKRILGSGSVIVTLSLFE